MRNRTSLVLFLSGCFGAVPDPKGDGDTGVDYGWPCDGEGNMVGTPLAGSDNDGDGFPVEEDCNDCDASISPGIDEFRCDGIDDNCNGVVDENVTEEFFADVDEDGYGNPRSWVEDCEAPSGYVENPNDCDDLDDSSYPDAPEYCDGIDHDCDGNVNEDDSVDALTWYGDTDSDGFGDSDFYVTACSMPAGFIDNDTDCDDLDADVNPGAVEVCDEIDNDCDGRIDDADQGEPSGNLDLSTAIQWFADTDSDGYGAPTYGYTYACSQPSGYQRTQTDCDDDDPLRNPGEAEICDDGVQGDSSDDFDNDCDPTNDTYGASYCEDLDGDGYGHPTACVSSCTALSGYVLDNTDCDDYDASVNPGATELCDFVDNDCDGTTDEDDAADALTWYADTDADGYGDASSTDVACAAPSGYVSDATDCDDTLAGVNPGAHEYCSTSYDDDCDGSINESSAIDATDWYRDADSDGYGDPTLSATACTAPTGYVATALDCDDTDATVSGGSPEVCDGIDNDCDSDIDEGVTTTYYVDFDADGYGVSGSTTEDCMLPSGYALVAGDCNDANSLVNPGATEVCNGTDDDCDGSTDEGVLTTYYVDTDGDSYGDPSVSTEDCTAPSGYVSNSDDCLDTDGTVNPDGVEIQLVSSTTLVNNCTDTLDNDCNGNTDSLDWDCMDADADGNPNGIDPFIIVDDDSDGTNEGVFLIQDNTNFSSLSGSPTLYVQGDFYTSYSSLSSADATSHSSRTVSGVSVDGWFLDITGEASGFSSPFRWVYASSTSVVCTTWEYMDVDDYCQAQNASVLSADDACWYEGASSGGSCPGTIGWIGIAEH